MFLKYLILTCISLSKWPQALFLINYFIKKKIIIKKSWQEERAVTLPKVLQMAPGSPGWEVTAWLGVPLPPLTWLEAVQAAPNTHWGNKQTWNKKLLFLTLNATETKRLFFFFKQYVLREWEIKFEESLPIREPPFNYNTQEITEWMAGTVIRDWHRRMTGTEIRPLHHKATYHKSLSGRLTIWLYCQLNS